MDIIKSINTDQHEILKDIITLYVPTGQFDLDPTYGRGNFYRHGVPAPRYIGDLNPRDNTIPQMDCCELPYEAASLSSIVFDPPFLPTARKAPDSDKMKVHFGQLSSIPVLLETYSRSLAEFHRVLKPKGIVVFKCQDFILSGKQNFIHIDIALMSTALGFQLEDLFILLAKNRVLRWTAKEQKHARKYHSYFWVLRKLAHV